VGERRAGAGGRGREREREQPLLSKPLDKHFGQNHSTSTARQSIDNTSKKLGWCVCLLLQYLIQSCARGGRRIVEDMCYEIQRAEACVD
jgi:hypothetical protein